MPDASSLRSILGNVDGSAPSIQNAAGAMMKFYDRGTSVAVNEWRNALQTCVNDQLLPLLYVANEVLQKSKRNRGNKFLEAMSPVLSQALGHICSRDITLVEKVRRTAKIWGDRQVFSTRFISDLLQGLEPYRHGRVPAPPQQQQESKGQSLPRLSSPRASFSPEPSSPQPTETDSSSQYHRSNTTNTDDDDIRNIMENNHHDDDDDDDIFASNDDFMKLDVEINLGSALDEMSEKPNTLTTKRRRSSLGSSAGAQGSSIPSSRKRRSAILSVSNLLELWTRLTDLQQQYDGAQLVLAKIDERLQMTPADELGNLVGDELQQTYQQNRMDEKQMVLQRQKLHAIAQERHVLEQEAKRYLPWLEKALKQDEDDIVFCDMLEEKIMSFRGIHAVTQKARDTRVAEERRRQAELQEMERKRKEEEEQEQFRQAALAKETEAKPNMVWNPSTREYQYLNTDESWRE